METIMQQLAQYSEDGVYSIPVDEMTRILETSVMSDKKPRRKQRQTTDPNRPKRPQSAFFLWSAANREEVREDLVLTAKNSGLDEGVIYKDGKLTVSLSRVSKELGRRWKELSDEEKTPYMEVAAQQRDQYKDAMTAYEAEHGIAPKAKRATKFDASSPIPDTPAGWTGPINGYLEKSPKDPETGKNISRSYATFEEAVKDVERLKCGGITRTPTGYKIRVATSVSINDNSRAKGEISWIFTNLPTTEDDDETIIYNSE